jgi:ATP-dependent exoDNAse (exonuclease V) alpha subunit
VKVILSNGSVGSVLRFEQLNENSAQMYPVVYFPRRGASPLTVRIKHHQFEQREHPRGPVIATRTQFPLQLCYAFSAHKSQGQTITCNVVADLASSFAYGQAYVMLSRVCALEQLYLSSYHRAAIKAHPDVTRFYEQLRLAAKN